MFYTSQYQMATPQVTADEILDTLPIVSEFRAGYAFGSDPSFANAAILAASFIDLGAVVKGLRQVSKIDRIGIKGPLPNNGVARPHGAADHNAAIDQDIGILKDDPGVTNIRKNQTQVDVDGNRVGNNRPDVQYDKDGKHHTLEYDRTKSRGDKHREKIEKNDPNVVCHTMTLCQ
jgi:hypothetical protein